MINIQRFRSFYQISRINTIIIGLKSNFQSCGFNCIFINLQDIIEINEDQIRKNISNFLNITKGNIIEIIMKDNHTLGNNPENIINWVKIVREEINKKY